MNDGTSVKVWISPEDYEKFSSGKEVDALLVQESGKVELLVPDHCIKSITGHQAQLEKMPFIRRDGHWIIVNKSFLYCLETGAMISIEEVEPSGKKKRTAKDHLQEDGPSVGGELSIRILHRVPVYYQSALTDRMNEKVLGEFSTIEEVTKKLIGLGVYLGAISMDDIGEIA